MSDFLLELGQNRTARRVIQRLGLPLPLPETLLRGKGAWGDRELADRQVLVAAAPSGALGAAVAEVLARDGADVWLRAGDGLEPMFRGPGEAWGRPARVVGDDQKVDAIVLDASGVTTVAGLAILYEVGHAWVGKVTRSGRFVVLARPEDPEDAPEAAAARRAIDGFVRSVAKELGRRGGTALRIVVEDGAEARVGPVLRWALSARAAWMTGQTVRVNDEVEVVPGAGAWPRTRPLEGQVALVTGAARGIGQAIAERFAAEGAKVICVDRPGDEGPLSQVARAVGGVPLLLDVASEGAGAAMVAATEALGGLDVLVHNAGVTRDKTLARMAREHWDQALGINLGAVVETTKQLVHKGLKPGARIVCLSSIAGIAGNFGQTNYAASKAGLIGFVAALAPRLSQRGITVNAIAPGFVETRLTQAVPVVMREVGRRFAALGQGGLPVDIAELALFLGSPGAFGVTGQTLRLCGGNYLGA